MSNQIENKSFDIPLEDDLYLRGNVHAPKERSNKPVIIICHGFKGFKDWSFFPHVADELANEGFYAVRFNFSCNGVNESDFDELEKFAVNTYSRELEDLAVLFDHMKEERLPFAEEFDLERIGMIGHSRGGAISILFAAEHPEIKTVVTWNGVSEVDFLSNELKDQIRSNGVGYIPNKRTNQDMPIKAELLDDIGQNRERFNIIASLQSMQTPVHIVQGDQDSEWLVEGAEKMKDAASQHSLAVITEADHTFNSVHPFEDASPELRKALTETTSFFKQNF
ncbi:alpha/beta hydrolase family protein [Alteribacillus sp. HJP-4]|uniref:alpha/beta hydrolase family protein n=1 Tax=Alteribacillus sp. HJP-4 TaxID=2775394 RepID=UPI0035CD2C21